MLFGAANVENVSEFRESPFVRNHLKYSTLMSFVHKGVEYKVGDCFRSEESLHPRHIYQICSIEYRTHTNLHPDMYFVAKVFTSATYFYKRYPHVRLLTSPKFREYVEEQKQQEFQPKDVYSKVSLVPYSADFQASTLCFFCRYAHQQRKLVPYTPLAVHFCDEYIEKGMLHS